jgi:RNA polymerase sigma-32 factor
VALAQAGSMEARDRVLRSVLRLLYKRAHAWARTARMLEVDDLVSEGVFGVVRAIEKFDPTKGASFVTYAVQWIDAFMGRAVGGDSTILSASSHAKQRSRSKGYARALAELDGWSEEEKRAELQRRYKMSELTAMSMRWLGRGAIVSMDAPLDEDDRTLHDLVASATVDADREMDFLSASRFVKSCASVAARNDRDRFILEKRILAEEPLTLQQIANVMSLSRERVRQVELVVVKRLRSAIATKMSKKT